MELHKAGILFRLVLVAGLIWLAIFFMLIPTNYGKNFPGNLPG